MKRDFDDAFMKGATITIFVLGVLLFLFFYFVVPAGGTEAQQDDAPYACKLCRDAMDWMGIEMADVVELLNPQTLEPVLADGTPVAEPHTIQPAFTG